MARRPGEGDRRPRRRRRGEQLARDALELARATDYLELQAASLTALAEVLDRAGRPDEAARIFERKGDVVSAQRARALGQAFAGA